MNKESSLFNPTDLELSRSTFDFHPTRSGTCVAGRLIPAFAFEVLPGDSIKMNLNTLVKMSTPVYPTMDELFMDVAFYFVPNRLILGRRYGSPAVDDANNSWKAFIGAQDNLLNMPVPAEGVTLPVVVSSMDFSDSSYRSSGSLADYFALPSSEGANITVPCLETLSYVAIWNENYRDPNTMEPVTWFFQDDNYPNQALLSGFVPLRGVKNLDYADGVGVPDYKVANALNMASLNPGNQGSISDVRPFPTCRFHDYFGSCLPWPQRNQEGVELPLGDSAPVYPMDDTVAPDELYGLKLGEISGSTIQYPAGANLYIDDHGAGALVTDGQGSEQVGSQPVNVMPVNLFADLRQATSANINALRLAVQKQRWYEKLARSGNRFDELEYGLFGVRPHDSGDDRPLYLGGKRIPLKIEIVASTNGGDSSSSAEGSGSLGSLGAFSHTNDSDNYFYHSFDEWGTLMCVFTIRHHTTVANGLSRKYSRKTREDYYWPTYAHLGEQAVLRKEIYSNDPGDSLNDSVFGYQEAWAEYRYEPDRVSGLLRPGQNLDFMTYAEDFSSNFTLASFLNASWQVESIDKTLQVKSFASGFQFVYQFNFDFTARRCMPEYSIPGMVDHF